MSIEPSSRTLPPIFQEPPDGLDGDWRHGVLLVGLGMYETMEWIDLARTYSSAALSLVERALAQGVEWDNAHPALFMCRHTLELYLKAIFPEWKSIAKSENRHDVGKLGSALKQLLDGKYRDEDVERLCGFIDEFGRIDPKSMVFRFPDGATRSYKAGELSIPDHEIWVDFHHLLETMIQIFEALDIIWLNRLKSHEPTEAKA